MVWMEHDYLEIIEPVPELESDKESDWEDCEGGSEFPLDFGL
jgi:hypothetical protein